MMATLAALAFAESPEGRRVPVAGRACNTAGRCHAGKLQENQVEEDAASQVQMLPLHRCELTYVLPSRIMQSDGKLRVYLWKYFWPLDESFVESIASYLFARTSS